MGLRYESLAQMPEGMRRMAVGKMAAEAAPVAGSGGGNKYHNRKTTANGIKFDSLKEARRYQYLSALAAAGVISDLRLQEDFTLQESYTTAQGDRIRSIRYRADFTYRLETLDIPGALTMMEPRDIEYWSDWIWEGKTGKRIIEDVKSVGTRTKEYRIKRKLMAQKGYIIREV